jgi:hypothetical protein
MKRCIVCQVRREDDLYTRLPDTCDLCNYLIDSDEILEGVRFMPHRNKGIRTCKHGSKYCKECGFP